MKLVIFGTPNEFLNKQELTVMDPGMYFGLAILSFISSLVPEGLGFHLTILAEFNPQVNILPATVNIFR